MARMTDTSSPAPLWLLDRFTPLIDLRRGEIGRVVTSEKEPAGAHEFCFWADDDALTLDVGHIVVAFSEEAAIIGVVDQPRRYSDLRTFLDDYFDRHLEIGVAEETPTRRPEILVFTVTVLATKHLRDDVQSKRPAVSGPVYFATPDAIEYALNKQNFSGNAIPALMHTNGNYERDAAGVVVKDVKGRSRFQRTPLYLDEDYLLGPEAGHANWTGQSGLATKTSHAVFLISSIFQTLEKAEVAPGEKRKSVAALMFNVKGPDLLWLDKPAKPDDGLEDAYRAADARSLSTDDLDAYAAMGLEARAFENFRIFAPFKPGQTPQPAPNGEIRLNGFRDHGNLYTERNMRGETQNVFPILWDLKRALSHSFRIFDRFDLDDKLAGFLSELEALNITSMHQLHKQLDDIEQTFEVEGADDYWRGHHKATIRKAKNRLNNLEGKLGGLLGRGNVVFGATTPQVSHRFTNHELRVVDISQCNTLAQELIVSSTINDIWRLAERSDMGVDKLIVFVDELNKYAGPTSGLQDTLVDIAARGRHLNVVLLGAQQFRSKVNEEVLGNCGTSFYGRIGDEEITNAAYRSISNTTKAELLGLQKGRLLARHAHFRAPLFGQFPMPPTVTGVVGQRVFGSDERKVLPGDSLHSALRQLRGGKAPTREEVLIHARGLPVDDVQAIAEKILAAYRGNTNGRSDPWVTAKRELDKLRDEVGAK
jgi:hypothetical protein